VAILLNLVK